MKNFYQYPFVFITIGLVSGIAFGDLTNPFWTLLLFLPAIFSELLFRRSPTQQKLDWIQLFAVFSIFFFLGTTIVQLDRQKIRLPAERGIAKYLVEVSDFSPRDHIWKKSILSLKAELNGKSIIPLHTKALVYVNENLEIGDQLIVNTRFEPIKNSGNPGEFDAESYWKRKGVSHQSFINSSDYYLITPSTNNYFSTKLNEIRAYSAKVLEANLDPELAGIAKAMILGDKSDLSLEARNSFSNTGAMHVLAVSGLHVGIIMFLLMYFLKWFSKWISSRNAFLLVFTLTWFYAALTGFSPSVLRAALMFSIVLGAQLKGSQGNSLNALFISAFILLTIDPNLLYDIGFQLSYSAMIGILVLYKPVASLINLKNKFLRKIWEGTAVGLAAQLVTFPLTLYYFHQFPNYFALSNLGVMLLAGIILGLGIALLLLAKIPYLNWLIGFSLLLSVYLLMQFIIVIEMLPFAVAYGFQIGIGGLILFSIFLISLLIRSKQSLCLYSLSGLCLVLLSTQLKRAENLSDREFVIFNASTPILAIKQGTHIYCFHKENDKAREKAHKLLNDYQKLKPGQLHFTEFTNQVIKIGENIVITPQKNGITIHLNSRDYFLRTSHYAPNMQHNIDMPYLPSDQNQLHALSQGAFRIQVNQ